MKRPTALRARWLGAANRARSRWDRRGLAACDRGQEIVEFALLTPLLLILLLGTVEAGRAIGAEHRLSSISREAANLASRGATLNEALQVAMTNGGDVSLATRGGGIATRIVVDHSVPVVREQVTSPGYEQASLLGLPDSTVAAIQALDLDDGQTVYAVEVFLNQPAFTPLPGFIGSWLGTLYERAIF